MEPISCKPKGAGLLCNTDIGTTDSKQVQVSGRDHYFPQLPGRQSISQYATTSSGPAPGFAATGMGEGDHACTPWARKVAQRHRVVEVSIF